MRRGFTMIEVMVAGAILAIGCLGILAMLITTINYNREAHLRTQAVTLAEQQLAILEAQAKTPNNWDNNSNSIIYTLQNNVGSWVQPNNSIINVNGAAQDKVNNNMPPAQFAIAYYVSPANGFDTNQYLRGSLRVIWNRRAGANCLTLNSIQAMETRNNDNFNPDCDFVSIPFALRK